jgi:hypothetical protein
MTRTAIDTEQVRVEAGAQKWRERLRTEEKLAKANINLDKQLREEEALLKEKKRNLKVLEAAFCEAVEKSAHPRDDQALLSERGPSGLGQPDGGVGHTSDQHVRRPCGPGAGT